MMLVESNSRVISKTQQNHLQIYALKQSFSHCRFNLVVAPNIFSSIFAFEIKLKISPGQFAKWLERWPAD